MHVRRRGSPTAPSALVHRAWPRSGAERVPRAGTAAGARRIPCIGGPSSVYRSRSESGGTADHSPRWNEKSGVRGMRYAPGYALRCKGDRP
jgi:hypothetical protein